TLTTPQRYSAISLLTGKGNGTSVVNGGNTGTVIVNWSGGTTSTFNYTSYDWFAGANVPAAPAGTAFQIGSRVNRGTDAFDSRPPDPQLFFSDINLATDPNFLANRLIQSVTINHADNTASAADTTII